MNIMAVKKSELYSSLWASCDSLRGGMDSSQYKDYILTLLFVKYVSDKFKGVAYGDIIVPEGGSFDDMLALIGNKNIGEKMDKIIAKLAEANNLRGVIDNAHFNDDDKLGKGDEMVAKLSELLCIFRDKMPNFPAIAPMEMTSLAMLTSILCETSPLKAARAKGSFTPHLKCRAYLPRLSGLKKPKAAILPCMIRLAVQPLF
jgi:type I restriction enzyme M protein